MLEIAAFLLPLAIGVLFVAAWPPLNTSGPRWARYVFQAGLGALVGIGLASVLYFLLVVSGAATPATILGSETAALILALWIWQKRRTPAAATEAQPGFRWTWALATCFGIVLAFVWTRIVQLATALPVGDWDAWAIWNLRAKFLAGPPGAWRSALSPLIDNTHPDYPLLLSGFIASVWKCGGTTDTLAPIAVGMLFFAALIALLTSAVALLRSTASGLMAGLVLLSTTSLLIWTPAQYSDVPLAAYILGAVALLSLEASTERAPLFWAGMCAGLAAWTKNEGLAFLIWMTMVYFLLSLRKRGLRTTSIATSWLLLGALPGLLCTAWLKLVSASATDTLLTHGASGLRELTDFARHAVILRGFLSHVLTLGNGIAHPLILLLILILFVRPDRSAVDSSATWITSITLLLGLVSFYVAFLITPNGATWQVETALDRLILQIWPAALLIFFVWLRRVADPAVAPAKSNTTEARRKKK